MGRPRADTDLAELMRRTLSGDTSARDTIWTRRVHLDDTAIAARREERPARTTLWIVARPHLERIALASGASIDDLPDLVQETLLAAYRHMHSFDPVRGSFRAWLVTILFHIRNNQLRRRARRRLLLEALHQAPRCGSASADGSDPSSAGTEASLELSTLLTVLTDRQRTVLVLFWIGGLGGAEIGRILGMTAAGARSSARDARKKLARRVRGSAHHQEGSTGGS
ncbi:MAG: sigma-70 family RNA polymerase sigma factor [Acidobacteria bacterium]|nr:sigma-70 family RNA polymerase sigma factor [Acidobacteriota bacterium]